VITYTNRIHVAETEIDPATGAVRITGYVVLHDCGRVINPMMRDGQVMGAVNGVGATFYEWMRYGDDGQPLTFDYACCRPPTPLGPSKSITWNRRRRSNCSAWKAPPRAAPTGPAALASFRDLPVTPARLVPSSSRRKRRRPKRKR
jgi:Molybdopterin-binding domain of aldehyde dehydrogenase